MRLMQNTWLRISSTLATWLLLLIGAGGQPMAETPKPLYGVPVVKEPGFEPDTPPTDEPDIISVEEEELEPKEQPCVYGPPPADEVPVPETEK